MAARRPHCSPGSRILHRNPLELPCISDSPHQFTINIEWSFPVPQHDIDSVSIRINNDAYRSMIRYSTPLMPSHRRHATSASGVCTACSTTATTTDTSTRRHQHRPRQQSQRRHRLRFVQTVRPQQVQNLQYRRYRTPPVPPDALATSPGWATCSPEAALPAVTPPPTSSQHRHPPGSRTTWTNYLHRCRSLQH